MIPLGRSHRATLLVLGGVVFMTLVIGLLYSHMDNWQLPTSVGQELPTVDDTADPPNSNQEEEKAEEKEKEEEDYSNNVSAFGDEKMREMLLTEMYKPLRVDAPEYKLAGSFDWKLEGKPPSWREPLKEKLCIIDLDNRPFDEPGQIFSDKMSWDEASEVHGLSVGFLNHWLYAKIHGYTYYYIEIEEYEDRRTSWKKPPIMSEILKKHDTCIYIDSDAIFHHLDLPFEWLMNYWQLDKYNTSLALALDPDLEHNKNKFGELYLNTGFIIAQNNHKTFEVMDAWEHCPDDNSKYPGCQEFRLNDPGRPTDQGGFGTFIRYDYAESIKQLPCTEANGFLESKTGCAGLFIQHLWTGKWDWIKVRVAEQLPGKLLEIFHNQFKAEKESFYYKEADLMGYPEK